VVIRKFVLKTEGAGVLKSSEDREDQRKLKRESRNKNGL
jgi:hypothetical protein